LLPVSVMFGIYSLSIFHFRLSAIKERRNTKAFEDTFGPYLLVFVFVVALILSAIMPIFHLGNHQTIQYPFIPSDMPYNLDLYEFQVPLTAALFPYVNRTTGLNTLIDLLEMMSSSPENYFKMKRGKKINIHGLGPHVMTIYSLPNYNGTSFSLTSSMPDDETTLEIFGNGNVNFKSVPAAHYNSSIAKGADTFVLSSDSKKAQFVLRSVLYKSVKLSNFRDVENTFPNTARVLGIPLTSFDVPLSFHREEHYVWTQDEALLGNTPIRVHLKLAYFSSSGTILPAELPIRASVEISFKDQYKTDQTFLATRQLVTHIFEEQTLGRA